MSTETWGGTRYEQCDRKIRHLRLATARRAIARMQKAGKPTGNLTPYACRFCDGWHVGNKRRSTS